MAVLGVNDAELGRRLGISRQAAHARRTGRTAMTATDLEATSEAVSRAEQIRRDLTDRYQAHREGG